MNIFNSIIFLKGLKKWVYCEWMIHSFCTWLTRGCKHTHIHISSTCSINSINRCQPFLTRAHTKKKKKINSDMTRQEELLSGNSRGNKSQKWWRSKMNRSFTPKEQKKKKRKGVWQTWGHHNKASATLCVKSAGTWQAAQRTIYSFVHSENKLNFCATSELIYLSLLCTGRNACEPSNNHTA